MLACLSGWLQHTCAAVGAMARQMHQSEVAADARWALSAPDAFDLLLFPFIQVDDIQDPIEV